MKAVVSLSVPDDAELTMMLTMTVGQARALALALQPGGNSERFFTVLSAAIAKATTAYDAWDEVHP